jgi:hypothetical protein
MKAYESNQLMHKARGVSQEEVQNGINREEHVKAKASGVSQQARPESERNK